MRGDLGLAKEQRALADSLAESRGTQVTELKVRSGISCLLHVDMCQGTQACDDKQLGTHLPWINGAQCNLEMTAT